MDCLNCIINKLLAQEAAAQAYPSFLRQMAQPTPSGEKCLQAVRTLCEAVQARHYRTRAKTFLNH